MTAVARCRGLCCPSVSDSSASWLRRNVSLVQVLGVKEQTRSDRRRDLYLLVPSAFQTSATVLGSFQARQEWSFLGAMPHDALKLVLEAQSDQDGRLQGNGVRGRRGEAALRYDRTEVGHWSWGRSCPSGVSRRCVTHQRSVAGSGTRPASAVAAWFQYTSAPRVPVGL